MKRNSYDLVLVPLKDPIPETLRLKALLKCALRRYAFRCKVIKPRAREDESKATRTTAQTKKGKKK